jgi:hypothetical protein
VKVTVDGTDKDGNPTHNEWTGKFDGNDYPVTGDPNSDARSLKKIDDRTLELTVKKGGKHHYYWSHCRLCRRQKSYGYHERNRCDGQKDHQHRGLRQAVRGTLRHRQQQ